MQDYHAIEALYHVLKSQSFEKAAAGLRITQSAISQRIKNLESFHGEPVLLRTKPYKTTKLGDQLIRLYAQLKVLEQGFINDRTAGSFEPKISIALNRDSIETWFLSTLSEASLCNEVLLEIIADDQECTLEYFKNGLATACLSTQSKAIKGAETEYLGAMTYALVASPAFLKRYEFAKDERAFFKNAPALQFDRNDNLHERYLGKYLSHIDTNIPYKIIPSVAGFKKYALLGFGYGLIPIIDIINELKSKKLINLYPEKRWDTPLYWHMWSIKSAWYEKINAEIINHAQRSLRVHLLKPT